jgi:hypothetical protein
VRSVYAGSSVDTQGGLIIPNQGSESSVTSCAHCLRWPKTDDLTDFICSHIEGFTR